MNYSELVDEYIKKSGLSLGEISRKMLEEKGIKADRSYISKLRNDPKYPASDEINRALSEITGGDPDKLIWASYLEKAPEKVKQVLKNIKNVNDVNNIARYLDKVIDKEKTKEEVKRFMIEQIKQALEKEEENGSYYKTKKVHEWLKQCIQTRL